MGSGSAQHWHSTGHRLSTGSVNKHTQINIGLGVENREYWGSAQLHPGQGLPIEGQVPNYVGSNRLGYSSPTYNHPGVPQAIRSYGSVYLSGAVFAAMSQTPIDAAHVSLLNGQILLGLGFQNSNAYLRFSDLVERTVFCDEGVPLGALYLTVTLVSDVSDLGWGTDIGRLRTQGLRTQDELSLHVNVGEVRAIRLACQVFFPPSSQAWL